MSNYPHGVTQRDVTNLCQPDNRQPNRHDCILCGREIEQDDDTRWWYFADEFVYWKPVHYTDFITPIETYAGMICSKDCLDAWNADENDEPAPRHGLFLVKGRTA